jgi:hypothetical protein
VTPLIDPETDAMERGWIVAMLVLRHYNAVELEPFSKNELLRMLLAADSAAERWQYKKRGTAWCGYQTSEELHRLMGKSAFAGMKRDENPSAANRRAAQEAVDNCRAYVAKHYPGLMPRRLLPVPQSFIDKAQENFEENVRNHVHGQPRGRTHAAGLAQPEHVRSQIVRMIV